MNIRSTPPLVVTELPDETLARLRLLAADDGTSLDDLVRRALAREARRRTQDEMREIVSRLNERAVSQQADVENSTVTLRAVRDAVGD